jgi:tRNA threonylcarbamoyladenosine biosynthesis protein TsaB
MNASSQLLIDTSLRNGWVGVSRDAKIVAERLLDPSRGHARDLTSAIAAALHEAQLQLPQMSGIALNVGPGSFTGIRVALATAKAIAYSTGINLIAIDTFDLAAGGFAGADEDFRVVIDFQLNGWLICDFARQPDGAHRRGEIRVLTKEQKAELQSSIPVSGPGIEKLVKQVGDLKRLHSGPWVPSREAFLTIALNRTRANDFADPFTIEPVYATMSSAEQLWQNRPGVFNE